MADNYTALKSSQKKRYISKETFNSLDLSTIPVGSEYEVVSPIEKGDLSADINNALNKAEKSISEPTNQTTGSDGDVLVKKGGGSEWKSMPVPTVVQGTGQSTTDVMSQKATTDSLNALELELNGLAMNRPNKTYLLWFGKEFPNSDVATFKAYKGSTIDWGDGTVETFSETATSVTTHTYTDDTSYHIISIANIDFSSDFYQLAFSGCSNLMQIVLGGDTVRLPIAFLNDCRQLKEVVIPETIGIIELNGIDNSITLRVLSKRYTLSTSSGNAFNKVIVAREVYNMYKSDENWANSNIVYEVDSTDVPSSKLLEELIYRNPNYTYLLCNGTETSFTNINVGAIIDWGDGNTTTTTQTYENSHTYRDNLPYHIIEVQNGTAIAVGALSTANIIKVHLGLEVISIEAGGFNDSQRQTVWDEFVIPQNVTAINFYGVYINTLKNLIMKPTTPPTLESMAFYEGKPDKIIVPKSAINAYKAATGWSTYADKIVYEVDSSDLPDTSKFAKLNGNNEFIGRNTFYEPILIYGNKAAIKDVDDNTFYFPANLDRPSLTYTLATTDDVDAKSSFSVEVW